MLQLRLLGSIELHDPSGLPFDASILQPKRLGLLAYLVAAAPGSLFRRDDLAALFWPELDDQHARNSLSQILHQLRKALGPDVIVTRGAAEIGVDPQQLWCDAVALEQALRRGAVEDAAELYRGDFLKGFHVDASPDFEQWLDQHREHLRARTAEALWKHVDANQHDPQAALAWARRAHALARGPDETAVRRLLHAYRAAGDISGGIHAYRAFERALADEFDASPSEETQNIYTTLLSTLGPARKEPRRHFGFGEVVSRLDTSQPQRRRRTVYALAGLALIASLGLIAYLAMPRRSAAQAAPVMAVFPFQYRGPASDAYLGEGTARLVGSGVSASEAMRVIDAHTLSASLKNTAADLSQARVRGLANKFDADLIVTGEVLKLNHQLRITARVTNTEDDRATTHMVEGPADSAFALVSTLTARVLAASSRNASASIDVAANTTHSPIALKQFVEGDAAFRHGNYKEAVAHYSHAVADDSLFALAHYRLSRAANWTGEYATSTTAANRAVALRSRLPEPMRSQVLAWFELMSGHVKKAEPLYRSILAEHPSEIDALEDMAELSFHWGASVGHPVEESRGLWERVLAIDGNKADAIVHLLRIFARTRDLHAFESWQDKLHRLSPSADRQIEAKLLHAFAFGTEAQRAAAAKQVDALEEPVKVDLILMVAGTTDYQDDVVRKLLAVLFEHRSFSSREAGHVVLEANSRLAAGKVKSAWATLDSVRQLDPERAQEYRAIYAALPLPKASPETMRSVRAELIGPAPVSVRHAYYVPARLFLRGILDVRLGDLADGEQMMAQLQAVKGTETVMRFAEWYSRLLRAELLHARGRSREALDALGDPQQVPDGRRPHIWSYAKAEERFLRAELLRQLGRRAEAIRWYATFPDLNAYDLAYLPAARLEEARLREAMGDRDGAALAYLKFMTMWSKPDAEHAPILSHARAAFEHLGR